MCLAGRCNRLLQPLLKLLRDACLSVFAGSNCTGGLGGGATGGSQAPRQTGSLATHTEDHAITRIKNIRMIELGQYRIKPWYFSPYPEVDQQYKITFCEYLNLIFFVQWKTFTGHLSPLYLRH